MNEAQIRTQILNNAPSQQQGRASYKCYLLIQLMGLEEAHQFFRNESTWANHLKILTAAGVIQAAAEGTH
ncbi:hypothetical protein BJI67_08130 [Acidihalobacter aeolianus]|uniref:Uncharacterized protein n=1 Tax=Acidihalobacter aeolianus TaxID=2792603 RepID=A0A1D8K7S9_9GAMM|nr:hypothetical protein [Acidihalobacter aeolianus]AOV17029.1 hypothetical protein BJI67_08130 [Acidihalobacter aeolianus]